MAKSVGEYVMYVNDNGIGFYRLEEGQDAQEKAYQIVAEHEDDPDLVQAYYLMIPLEGEPEAHGIYLTDHDDSGPGEDAIQTWDGSWRVF